MLYDVYQSQEDMMGPFRFAARSLAPVVDLLSPPRAFGMMAREMRAALEIFGNSGITHKRPDFGIKSVRMGNRDVPIIEEVAHATPFGNLLHFRKDSDQTQPRVLIAAPLSGHFATLLRNTVEVLLQDHDVYITDWNNARDIPLSAGRFGFDDYVDHIMRFMREIGPGGHVVAVCQPAVAVLAATALMAEADDAATPRTMTLMGGPIDTRRNPSKVNALAKTRDIAWFRKNLIATVPARYAGAGRAVYPGFMQLASFVSMNLDRHIGAHLRQFRSIVTEDGVSETAHRKFYDEYQSVMDLTAEFYLETVERVFQRHDLPTGSLIWRGQTVKPEAIRKTFLFTVEGERDDICPPGQSVAALDLCSGLKTARKRNHLQLGVGHYGVFSGSRWANDIYPQLREIIALNN
ncbi:polyhydroxyalkanoate depolymerase [Acidiphilium sp. PA]|uniref:polyhydroxyalkanoate depolymerase n=1 Tax=Acidiphilium sp. PA TaxID=2871705 RepID=UPI0022443780|nr:polyhydroxyalkanoate depolymerase [Acidiphilium sp. PA]MCW8306858.1 polyhydroxyalkanoate depolymerase [Acidiphilium sp. PA]